MDFRPGAPNNLALKPFVFQPVAADTCSNPDTNEISLGWLHGAEASDQAITAYRVDLFKETCGNRSIPNGLCVPIIDPQDPKFGQTLAFSQIVEHNHAAPGASQQIVFSREALFSAESDEQEETVTGFLVHLQGISGKVPGPAGLNITGTFATDLPVLPADMGVNLIFSPGTAEHPEWAMFEANALTRKNPQHDESWWPGPYDSQFNAIDVRLFEGPGCDAQKKIAASSPGANYARVGAQQQQYPQGTHPVVSARARLQWQGCKVMESACMSIAGSNPNAAPDPVTGFAAERQGNDLGASWDGPSNDPAPATVEYRLSVAASGNDPANILVNQPAAPLVIAAPAAQSFGGTRLGAWLATLTGADAGKIVVLSIKACRAQKGDLCSTETLLPYQIAGSAPADPAVDLSAGVVEFDYTFWGRVVVAWQGSSTPDMVDHYAVELDCSPTPDGGDLPVIDISAADVADNNAVYLEPPASNPHHAWLWEPFNVLYAQQPSVGDFNCTVGVRACSSQDESACGSLSTATGFGQVGNLCGNYVGWDAYKSGQCLPP